jgi:hypothetical protein
MSWADPHIELVIADGPAPGRWSGISGMVEAWTYPVPADLGLEE